MLRELAVGVLAQFALSVTAAGQCAYRIDDGVDNGGIGAQVSSGLIALNQFTVSELGGEIHAVEVSWMDGRQTVTGAVWSDPNQDGVPSDGVLLGISTSMTAPYFGFQTLPLLAPVNVGAEGTSFFAGVYLQCRPFELQIISLDSTVLYNSSWLSAYPPGEMDPNDLSSLYRLSANLMIRALCEDPTIVETTSWGRIKAIYGD
jgi:hypothetical protein